MNNPIRYMEEVYTGFFVHPLWRRVFVHPQEDRFDHEELREAVEATGFRVIDTRRWHTYTGWIVAEAA